jgi:hypothetical protein
MRIGAIRIGKYFDFFVLPSERSGCQTTELVHRFESKSSGEHHEESEELLEHTSKATESTTYWTKSPQLRLQVLQDLAECIKCENVASAELLDIVRTGF